jgi:heptaprenyl diphosphate synthase
MQSKFDHGMKKTAYLGIFLALALICSYIESLIPFNFGIPGVKLGLTNIVVVWALYLMGTKEAFLISVLRILLSGMMFGNVFSIAYSMAGGILSFLAMVILKKTRKFKCVSVSITGGIFHNIGQLCVAALIVQNYSIFYYIPVLLISGTVTGLLIGIISQELIIRVKFRF